MLGTHKLSGTCFSRVYMFQSTRPVRGATAFKSEGHNTLCVSIHAPRAGRDLWTHSHSYPHSNVSIHAPRAGRDPGCEITIYNDTVFQSTRPVRGATAFTAQKMRPWSSFNPRAPCGARRTRCIGLFGTPSSFNPRAPCGARRPGDIWGSKDNLVSIHAPRAGRDIVVASRVKILQRFNPRAPCGARRPNPKRHNHH